MRIKIGKLVIAALIFSSCIRLFSFSPEIIDALNAIHRGNATKLQQCIAFANNRAINQMAYAGIIDKNVYLSNQKWFSEMNLKFAQNAGKQMGLNITVQANPSGIVKPGADSDYHVHKSTMDITLYEIKKLRELYGKEVETFFKDGKYQFKAGTEWAFQTNTDFMPPADQTREFVLISDFINNDMRGAAYRAPEAAIVESMIRDGYKHFSPEYAAQYSTEMNYQIGRMSRVIAENEAEIARLSAVKNPTLPQINTLKGCVTAQQMNDALVAKYVVRKYMITQMMAERYNVPMKYELPDIVKQAASRTQDTANLAKFVRVNANQYLDILDAEFKRIMEAGPQGKIAELRCKAYEIQFNLENKAADVWKGIKTSQPYLNMAAKFNAMYQTAWDKAAALGGRIQGTNAYQNVANFASRWGKPVVNAINNADNGTFRRFTNDYAGFKDVKPGSFSDKAGKWMQEKGFKYGGYILTLLVYYDIAKEAYATGEYRQGAINALIATGVMWGAGKVIGYVMGSFMASNPISATVIATFATSYLLMREFMSRVEYNGKTLDQHTQDYIDDQLFLSSQYDLNAQAEIRRLFLEALRKGHKLKDGMSTLDAWKKIMENYAKGGKIYEGVFDESRNPFKLPGTPGQYAFGKSTVINSVIKNEVQGTAIASDKSEINTGVTARGSYIKDSQIENKGNVYVEARDKSKINTGVNLDNANIQGTQMSVQTEGKIIATGGSNINAGIDANNARIRDSELRSTSSVNITAQDKSTVNTGIRSGKIEIKNSKLTNNADGTANAAKGSAINMGLKFEKADEEPDMSHFQK